MLLALGAAMMATNRWFTEVDDECAIIDWAAHPLTQTVHLFFGGTGQHEHPPLYDVLLHFWLQLTTGKIYLLRAPSVLFYIGGAWVLCKVAKQLGGERSELWLAGIILLWPFGFHFGRLTTWYSLSFLLVSLLTLAYVDFTRQPSPANSLGVLLSSAALVYCNYFGWAFLACLCLDYTIRNRRCLRRAFIQIAAALVMLCLVYLPMFHAFHNEVEFGTGPHFSLQGTILNLLYNVYSVFVSESVAPWYWFLGVPACLLIALCLSLTLWRAPVPAKGLLLYFLGLITALSALGAIIPKRVLIMSPWLLLPLALALGAVSNLRGQTVLASGLALIAGIGWFGIFARDLYAAPHWVEPWESIAREAAIVVGERGVVVGDNPSFFFYLTYLLPTHPAIPGGHGFTGLLPDSVRADGVYSAHQWNDAGHPVGRTTLLVKGLRYGTSSDVTEGAQKRLDSQCELQLDTRVVRDPGSQVKQRYGFIPQPDWRIETRAYVCR